MPEELNAAPPIQQEPVPEVKASRFYTEYYPAAYMFLLVAFVLIAVFVHRPMIYKVKQLKAETEQKVAAAQSEAAYLKQVNSSVGAAQAIPQDILDKVDMALPKDSEIPSLLLQLQAIARQDNIMIDNVSFNENKAVLVKASTSTMMANGVAPLEIQINLRTKDYFEFKRFLSDIEANLRLMDVVGVNAASQPGAKEQTYGLQLKVYTYPVSNPTK